MGLGFLFTAPIKFFYFQNCEDCTYEGDAWFQADWHMTWYIYMNGYTLGKDKKEVDYSKLHARTWDNN